MRALTGASADIGPIRFARYAYPPNRLGLCGPADAPALIDGAAAGASRELRQLALGFEGAYPYLRLIADENGVADPLDPAVVEAYWIGNDLTEAVRPRALHRSLDARFRDRMPVADWRWLERAVEGGSRPNHAFHVLEIFPRAGLLRGDAADPIVATIDACRIRWGRVIGVEADRLLVEARPLEVVDGLLRLGSPRAESATGWIGADGLLDGVGSDDWVSLHWGWACDRLSPPRLARLAAWTDRALAAANQAW
jgi:Family of unknown function (DUF6390)